MEAIERAGLSCNEPWMRSVHHRRDLSLIAAACSALALLGLSCSAHEGAPERAQLAVARPATLELVRGLSAFSGLLNGTGSLRRDEDGFRWVAPSLPGTSMGWSSLGRLDARLPRTSGAPLRLAIAARNDTWLEIQPLDVVDRPPVISGTALVMDHARVDTDLVLVAGASTVEELRVLRSERAPGTARYHLSRGPGIASVRVRDGRIEAVDHDGRVVFDGAPPFAVDATGKRSVVSASVTDDTLTLDVDTRASSFPVVVDPVWSSVGLTLIERRHHHATVQLPDGRVLVAGGSACSYDSITPCIGKATTEYLDLAKATASSAPSMPRAHYRLKTARLTDGRILFVDQDAPQAEIFRPSTATWVSTSAMAVGRAWALVPLLDGRVMSVSWLDGAEIYDPTADTWSAVPAPGLAAQGKSTAILPGGDVIAVGVTGIAKIFRTSTSTWVTAAATPSPSPGGVGAVSLLDGRVLVPPYVFQPTTGTWSTIILPGSTPPYFGDGIRFSDGKVLLTSSPKFTVFDPTTNVLANASPPFVDSPASTALLSDGSVLFSGGYSYVDVDGGTKNVARWSRQVEGSACDGAGACLSGACVDGRCCLTASCPCGMHCDATGRCGPGAKELGTTCGTGSECKSGFCADHVCCDRACSGQCESCSATPAGTCRTKLGFPEFGRPACTSPPPSKGDLEYLRCGARCDGIDPLACHFPAGNSCANDCLSFEYVLASKCDGAGHCVQTATDCSPGLCTGSGVSSFCKSTCTTAGNCRSGYNCVAGKCVPPCTSPSECATGFCVDGVCCDSACTGQCEGCNVFPNAGSCRPTTGVPRAPRPPCVVDPDKPCMTAACDGIKRTACTASPAPSTTLCHLADCNGSAYTPKTDCDGSGACPAAAVSCGAYACRLTGCLKSCGADSDCAPGYSCREATCQPAACPADGGVDGGADAGSDASADAGFDTDEGIDATLDDAAETAVADTFEAVDTAAASEVGVGPADGGEGSVGDEGGGCSHSRSRAAGASSAILCTALLLVVRRRRQARKRRAAHA